MANDSVDVTSSGKSFQICGQATGKARLPTVDSLLVCTSTRRLVPTECSDRRLGRSATRVNGPSYLGASPWMTLCQDGDLELDSLRDEQPMEAGERVRDVVGSPQVNRAAVFSVKITCSKNNNSPKECLAELHSSSNPCGLFVFTKEISIFTPLTRLHVQFLNMSRIYSE